MWAPADMFTGPVRMTVLPLKRAVSYFYEHTLVLLLVMAVIAALIAVVETRRG